MADGEERDHFGAVGTSTSSFSQLLLSDDDNDIVGLSGGEMGPTHSFDHHHHYYSSSTSPTLKPPKMLCFGGYDDLQYHHNHNDKVYDHNNNSNNNVVLLTPQKSGVTCSDSSSANNNSNNASVNVHTASKAYRKRNGSGQETVQCNTNNTTIAKTQRISKKTKMENPMSTGQPKARKEKLGERITALQQLVSPFGKTDTASVLHEAMGYIRFLQDQVQVLCSPYLQHHQPDGEENGEPRHDLRSRGLCLVPVEYTLHVTSSNGADYWSPAMVNNFSSSVSYNKQ